MLLSHFNRELNKTAIIFEFLGKIFHNLEKLFLDRTFPLRMQYMWTLQNYYTAREYWAFRLLNPHFVYIISCIHTLKASEPLTLLFRGPS